MGRGKWLVRKSRVCVPYREETWAERWERETGRSPDVEKVVRRGPGLWTHRLQFRPDSDK